METKIGAPPSQARALPTGALTAFGAVLADAGTITCLGETRHYNRRDPTERCSCSHRAPTAQQST